MSKTCPACGFVSELWVNDPNDFCPKCRLVYATADAVMGSSLTKVPEGQPMAQGRDAEEGRRVDTKAPDRSQQTQGAAAIKQAVGDTPQAEPVPVPVVPVTNPRSRVPRLLMKGLALILLVVGVPYLINGFFTDTTSRMVFGGLSIAVALLLKKVIANQEGEEIPEWMFRKNIPLSTVRSPDRSLKKSTEPSYAVEMAKPVPDFRTTQEVLGVEFMDAADYTAGAGKKVGLVDAFKAGMSIKPAPVSGLAIDEGRHKVCLINISHGTEVHRRVVSYKDVISVELFLDGASVSKTDQSSQAGGALVGGLMFGGLGMVVGALSGKAKTETTKKLDRIDLRLTLNDTQSPLHEVSFLHPKEFKGKGSQDEALQLARQWNGIVSAAIRQAADENMPLKTDQHQSIPHPDTAPPTAASGSFTSVADELKKLADLHSTGILTAEEFQQQKAKVLGSNH